MEPELDPAAQVILDALAASDAPHLSTLSVAEARARVRASFVSKGQPLPLHQVTDLLVPSPAGPLPLRLYRPCDGRLPVALFLHGGGWTLNDIDTHDELCRRLAERSGWLVASLDYRRAPEFRHPAQLQDSYCAYRWLHDNADAILADPWCVAVVGESSGGAIAVGLSCLIRDGGGPRPAYQMLMYPVADACGEWPSYTERGTGYILDRELMKWYFDQCAPEGPPEEVPYLLPLAIEDLARLPPTYILTAEFDPLRDEGVALADRLARAGVEVEHVHVPDQMHGCLLLERIIPRVTSLIDGVGAALANRRLGGSARPAPSVGGRARGDA